MARINKFELLISGFLIGQGSFFLAQTYLVVGGGLAYVGSLGIGLGLLSLVQWVSDCGGIYVVRTLASQNNKNWLYGFMLARALLVFLLVVCGSFILPVGEWAGSGVNEVVFWIPVVALISCLNLLGYLDLLGRNKWSSVLGGLPWLLASMAAVLLGEENIKFVGGAYAAGLFVSVLIQYCEGRKYLMGFTSGHPLEIIKIMKLIFGYVMVFINGQVYGRIVPVLVANFLGATVAGAYVYGKGVSNVIGQFVSYSRRIEFGAVCAVIKGKVTISSVLRLNFFSYCVSFFVSLLAAICLSYMYLYKYIDGLVYNVTLILLAVNFLWVLVSSFNQFCIAKKRYLYIWLVQIVTITLSLVVMGNFAALGLFYVFFAEVLMLGVQFIVHVISVKKDLF